MGCSLWHKDKKMKANHNDYEGRYERFKVVLCGTKIRK